MLILILHTRSEGSDRRTGTRRTRPPFLGFEHDDVVYFIVLIKEIKPCNALVSMLKVAGWVAYM
jgi:hypothetical protein